LNNIIKNIVSCLKNTLLLSLVLIILFATFSFAAQVSNPSKYDPKKYGPEYFYPIQGEVSGQAAPGVQGVYVNGKKIPIRGNLKFSTSVNLKRGQKYLSIETRYQGLRFIKKYLVLRHPKVVKPFKIHIPKKEFKKIIKPKKKKVTQKKKQRKRRWTRRKRRVKRKVTKKPKHKKNIYPKEKWLGYESISELEPGRFLIIKRVNGKYFALVYHSEKGEWVPLHKITYQEFKEILQSDANPSSFNS